MRLLPLGVRGSTAAPGAGFVRYGGNTSCVAVLAEPGEPPALLLDAGTGIRRLPALLDGRPFEGAILLTHLHWDHVQGLPFCRSIDRDDAVVSLWLPDTGRDPAAVLSRAMSPPHFPIGPDGLRGAWTFGALRPGRSVHAGVTVVAAEISHKGGRTYGYRVESGGRSAAYLPDHLPVEGLPAGLLGLVGGVDVLVHDGQFLAPERDTAVAFGHSTVDEAVALAVRAGAGRLVLTHHAPDRTDAQLDEIAAAVRDAPLPVTLAAEMAPILV
ncbi:MAG TPA: MBL fold metallo-hydrolase [Mycobacteriales bacterium]